MSGGHSAVCEWRWAIKTRLVEGCSWQPHQNFHYPQVTSADCFLPPPVCRIKPKYILFTSVQGDADLKIIAFFGKWNCVWCLTSKLVRAQLLLLINRLTVCCLVWMHWFWHAWHLAVVHPVEPEETNSDMFNRHSNIELSTISILCLGLIIGTLNIPFCTLQRFYFVQKKPIWIVCTYILIQLSSAKQPPAKNVFISKASFKKQTGFFYNCIFFASVSEENISRKEAQGTFRNKKNQPCTSVLFTLEKDIKMRMRMCLPISTSFCGFCSILSCVGGLRNQRSLLNRLAYFYFLQQTSSKSQSAHVCPVQIHIYQKKEERIQFWLVLKQTLNSFSRCWILI